MDKNKLIDALNRDLADELGAITQYLTYSAKITGPSRPQLADFFRNEIPDEQKHAEFLANKVVALGGEPTTVASDVEKAASNQDMLTAVLEAERRAIKGYTERAKQAEEFGDKALAVQLEDMIRDETQHAEEAERMLRDWSRAAA